MTHLKSYKNLKKIKSNISPFLPIFFVCNRFILPGNTFYLIDTFSLKRSIILKQRRNVENQIYLSLIRVEFFLYLIILTLYPHRQPYRGVSDWVQPILTHIRTHMYAHIHRYKIRTYEIIHLQTDIYAQKQKYNIRTQFAHNMHTHKHRQTYTPAKNTDTHRNKNKDICSTYKRT